MCIRDRVLRLRRGVKPLQTPTKRPFPPDFSGGTGVFGFWLLVCTPVCLACSGWPQPVGVCTSHCSAQAVVPTTYVRSNVRKEEALWVQLLRSAASVCRRRSTARCSAALVCSVVSSASKPSAARLRFCGGGLFVCLPWSGWWGVGVSLYMASDWGWGGWWGGVLLVCGLIV